MVLTFKVDHGGLVALPLYKQSCEITMMTLLDELRSVVPSDKYVDLSTISSTYFTKFGKKLTKQPGVKKVTLYLDSLPEVFQIDKTTRGNNIPYWLVMQRTQVVPNMQSETVPLPTAPVEHSIISANDSEPPQPKREPLHEPLRLSERRDVALSLSQRTASITDQTSLVPLGGLVAFICAKKATDRAEEGKSLVSIGKMSSSTFSGSSILGFDSENDSSPGLAVFINTTNPFCAVCTGMQGSGKSHTMNVILENSMLNLVGAEDCSIVSNPQPMCGLVLHYDKSESSNCCEAVGLKSPATSLVLYPELKVQRVVVLVSPTFYEQRKLFYGDNCEVIPLLFDWDSLTATQLKKLMRLSDSDAQLYVSVILNKLREYQRKNKTPSFDGFLEEAMALCKVPGQEGPLTQVCDTISMCLSRELRNRL